MKKAFIATLANFAFPRVLTNALAHCWLLYSPRPHFVKALCTKHADASLSKPIFKDAKRKTKFSIFVQAQLTNNPALIYIQRIEGKGVFRYKPKDAFLL